jgi:hypothetical protein
MRNKIIYKKKESLETWPREKKKKKKNESHDKAEKKKLENQSQKN